MFISDYIDALLAKGVFCFSGAEASDALRSGVIATRAALRRRVDELLGTKLRALYQRKKGRDLFKKTQTTPKRELTIARKRMKEVHHG